MAVADGSIRVSISNQAVCHPRTTHVRYTSEYSNLVRRVQSTGVRTWVLRCLTG